MSLQGRLAAVVDIRGCAHDVIGRNRPKQTSKLLRSIRAVKSGNALRNSLPRAISQDVRFQDSAGSRRATPSDGAACVHPSRRQKSSTRAYAVPEGFSVFNTSVSASVCFRLKRLPGMAFTHWNSAALAGHTPIAAIRSRHLIAVTQANVAQVLNKPATSGY